MPYCIHCGTKLQTTDRFCPRCGKPVTGNTPAAPRKNGPPWWFFLLIASAFITLIVFIFFTIQTVLKVRRQNQELELKESSVMEELSALQDESVSNFTLPEEYSRSPHPESDPKDIILKTAPDGQNKCLAIIDSMEEAVHAASELVEAVASNKISGSPDKLQITLLLATMRAHQNSVYADMAEFSRLSDFRHFPGDKLKELLEDFNEVMEDAQNFKGVSSADFYEEAAVFFEETDEFRREYERHLKRKD